MYRIALFRLNVFKIALTTVYTWGQNKNHSAEIRIYSYNYNLYKC